MAFETAAPKIGAEGAGVQLQTPKLHLVFTEALPGMSCARKLIVAEDISQLVTLTGCYCVCVV